MASDIDELVTSIHDRIDDPIKQSRLIENTEKWNRLCSSLDVIGDTQYAIEFYENTDFPEKIGGKYLFIYGLLQAFYVQQDAVSNMHKALYDEKIKFKEDYKKIFSIRQLRDDAVGHPTDRDYGKSFIFISRHSLTKDKFEIMITYQNGIDEFKSADVTESINNQKEGIEIILKETIKKLDNDIKEFKEKYSMKKLQKYFENDIGYIFGNLYEMTYETDKKSPMAGTSLKIITELVNNIRKDLLDRYGSFRSMNEMQFCYEEIDYLIDFITAFYQCKKCDKILIRFLIECLKTRLDNLEEMCKAEDDKMSV